MMDYKKIVEHYRTCHLTILKWSRGEGGGGIPVKERPSSVGCWWGIIKTFGRIIGELFNRFYRHLERFKKIID